MVAVEEEDEVSRAVETVVAEEVSLEALVDERVGVDEEVEVAEETDAVVWLIELVVGAPAFVSWKWNIIEWKDGATFVRPAFEVVSVPVDFAADVAAAGELFPAAAGVVSIGVLPVPFSCASEPPSVVVEAVVVDVCSDF